MLHLGIVLLILCTNIQSGINFHQDGAEDGATMTEFCYGIRNRLICDCNPSENEIQNAYCTLFYDPPSGDEIWNQIRANPTLTELRLISRPEGLLTTMPVHAINPNVLTDLTIEYSHIRVIPSFAFQNSSVLRLIKLSHDKIQLLEPYSFSYLPTLQEMILNENNLTIIKKNTFVHLPKLEILMLDRNKIELIEDGAFLGLNNLQELNLMDNSMQDLKPGLFKGLSHLKRLDLGNNNIRLLRHNSFTGLSRVNAIDLRENEIAGIDSQTFEAVPNLMKLYLIKNKLTRLHQDTFKPLHKLEYLDLRFNQLKTLTEKTILPINLLNMSTVYVLVEGNEFVCDCRLQWMVKMSTMRNSAEWKAIKCTPSQDEGPIIFDKKKEDGDLSELRDVQASEKHKNHKEIYLSEAGSYLETCIEMEEDSLNVRTVESAQKSSSTTSSNKLTNYNARPISNGSVSKTTNLLAASILICCLLALS